MQEKKELNSCFHCSKEIDENELSTIDGNMVCVACRELKYFECACGEFVLNEARFRACGENMCETCYDNNYIECCDCGDMMHNDDVNTDYDDNLCCSCYDNRRENEDDDNNEDNANFFREYKDTTKYLDDKKGEIIGSIRKFGIELECIAPDCDTLSELAEKISDTIGISDDGSLNYGDRERGIEFQTPLLSGRKGELLVKLLCKKLNDGDFKVNASCGFHVHIDGNKQFSVDEIIATENVDIYPNVNEDEYMEDRRNDDKLVRLRDLFCFYIAFEDVLLSFLPKVRRQNRYCRPLRVDYHIKEIMNARSVQEIESIWYRVKNEYIPRCKADHKHDSRYRGINLHSLIAMGHLEVRFHSGTINDRKILEWINLHTRIMDCAVHGGFSSDYLLSVNSNINIFEKTKEMFDILKITESSRAYFTLRQKKFAEVEAENTKLKTFAISINRALQEQES